MSSSDDSSIDEPVMPKKGKTLATKAANKAAPATAMATKTASKAAPAKNSKAKKRGQMDSDNSASEDDQPPTKNKASKRKAESDESDDSSGDDDDSYQPVVQKKEAKPPQKKGKAAVVKDDSDEDVSEDDSANNKAKNEAKNGKKVGKAAASAKFEVDNEGNELLPIGTKRFVTVNSFRGQINCNIREYYQKDGKWLPSKKGISLSQAQLFELEKLLPEIKKKMATV